MVDVMSMTAVEASRKSIVEMPLRQEVPTMLSAPCWPSVHVLHYDML